MRNRIETAVGIVLLVLAFTIICLAFAAKSHADPLPPNCQMQPWWRGEAMRMTQRIICDGPIQPDGSWIRKRDFYAPSYYRPVTCNWGYYGGSCYGGYWVDEYDSGIEQYEVRPDNVLPDEPGHIG